MTLLSICILMSLCVMGPIFFITRVIIHATKQIENRIILSTSIITGQNKLMIDGMIEVLNTYHDALQKEGKQNETTD